MYLFKKQTLLIAGLLFMLTACGGGGENDEYEFAGSFEPDTTLRASFNGIDYPIQVYLPADYAGTPQQSFPVLYVLDGEWRFFQVSQLVDELAKSTIVVGLGNTDQLVEGQRAIDYRMPGAQDYYGFLTLEVLPYIEKNYMIDVSGRTLSGHSYGGLFVGLTLLLETPGNRYFTNYLSQDGSFWHKPNDTENLEQQLSVGTSSLPARLILSGASRGNDSDVRWFRDLLTAGNYADFDLIYWEYKTTHEGQFQLSMEDALELIYP